MRFSLHPEAESDLRDAADVPELRFRRHSSPNSSDQSTCLCNIPYWGQPGPKGSDDWS